MIEKTLLDYLNDELSVPVSMETLTNEKFVTIEKTGSSQEDLIFKARFAIQSYADSLYDAALLNDDVKVALLGNGTDEYGIETLDSVCKCELNTDYNFTDTTTKKYRYQAIFDITHY